MEACHVIDVLPDTFTRKVCLARINSTIPQHSLDQSYSVQQIHYHVTAAEFRLTRFSSVFRRIP